MMTAADRIAEIRTEIAERNAKIVTLHGWNYSNREIANQLGTTKPTVDSVLSRRRNAIVNISPEPF
jgi:DNA-directed RNA polymerase specialized sigma24 family protein